MGLEYKKNIKLNFLALAKNSTIQSINTQRNESVF